MLDQTTIEQFKASLRGELIQPNDAGYDEARKVYNAMIDRRPRLIARCTDVADVITAVNFARENNVLVAIRGGGHNGAGRDCRGLYSYRKHVSRDDVHWIKLWRWQGIARRRSRLLCKDGYRDS